MMPSSQHDPLEAVPGADAWLSAAVRLDPSSSDESIENALGASTELIVEHLITEASNARGDTAHPFACELATLHALGRLCAAIALMVHTRSESDKGPLVEALIKIHALALQRTYEVETLIGTQLGEGAVIVSRPLYETSAKARVLRLFDGAPGCEHLAQDYLVSAMVETRANAELHDRTWGEHGHPYEGVDRDGLTRIAHEQVRQAASRGNSKLERPNGWAASANGGRVPRLHDLAALARVDDHRLAYQHGSHHIHANAYAALQAHHPVDGARDYGRRGSLGMAAAAGQYAALGLGRTCEALLGTPETDIEVRALHVLQRLSKLALQRFHDAQSQL